MRSCRRRLLEEPQITVSGDFCCFRPERGAEDGGEVGVRLELCAQTVARRQAGTRDNDSIEQRGSRWRRVLRERLREEGGEGK